MQELKYGVDTTLENVFLTVIGRRAGVGMVLDDGILTVSIYDEIPAGAYDPETGEVSSITPVSTAYTGGTSSTLSGVVDDGEGGDTFVEVLSAALRAQILEIDPDATIAV